ncbi:MAG: hypothetical protein LBU51_02305 [Bacteroidales bacterium]|nr:hypothetical protein [Bacteroidales bacterium]
MYPTYDGRYSEDHSVTEDNAFVNNAYFEEIDKILEEPALEPSLDRSTEVFYFV